MGVKSTTPKVSNKAMRLLKYNLVDTESLITHVVSLKDWKEEFALMESKKAIKVLLEP